MGEFTNKALMGEIMDLDYKRLLPRYDKYIIFFFFLGFEAQVQLAGWMLSAFQNIKTALKKKICC